MSERGSKASTEPRLTARQREWLGHLRACERSGETIKAYAARRGLSVQSLYQAAKRLRRRGVLEPSGRRESGPQGFVRVAVATAAPDLRSAWRIRLASGTIFESTTPLSGEQLLTLLERLARAR